jgi:uncharacterized membrane protein YkvA (DUF1232 family)
MKRVTDEDAQTEFNKYSGNVSDADIPRILKEEGAIMGKARGALAKFAEDMGLLFSMVKDYVSGAYREIPWTTITGVIGALVYILSPIDLIPDFIPFIGLIDDAAVLALCLKTIAADLHKYKAWKQRVPNRSEIPPRAEPPALEACPALEYCQTDGELEKAHKEEMRRLDEHHAKQMETLKKSLEQTAQTMLDAAVHRGAAADAQYQQDNPELEDVQFLHRELEKIRNQCKDRGYRIEENMRKAANIGFDIMLEEVERVKTNTGIHIDSNSLRGKFERAVARIEGSVTDVISRRVSLGDSECTEILSRTSRDEREDGLSDFLKKVAAESLQNVRDQVDDALWDALVMVSSVIANRLEDKKGQIQRAAAEYASMKKALSESEIAEKTRLYTEELKELNNFVSLIETI